MKLKYLLFIITFGFIFLVNAQKVKYKKDVVKIEKKPYAKIYKDYFDASIFSLKDGKELFFIKLMNGREGQDSYYLVRFMDLDAETELKGMSIKSVLRKVYHSNLIVDGELNNENVIRFVKKYGMDESRGQYYLTYDQEYR